MNLDQKCIDSRSLELQLLSDELSDLQELICEFNNLIHQQEIYIDNMEENINHSIEQSEQAIPEIAKAEFIQFKRRCRDARIFAAMGGGLIGTMGFLINPIIGLGTTMAISYGCWVKSKDIRRT